MNQVTGLIHFNRARQELQKAMTLDVVIAIRNAAAEIRLRAERRAGEMLRESSEKGDRQAAGRPQNSDKDVTISPKLAEIGISNKQASRWQSIATIPEVQFEQIIRETKEANRELTQSALLKVAREIRGEQPEGRRRPALVVQKKPVYKQESLFDLNDYHKTIDYHVSTANHHIRLAQHYRKQALKRYSVQIPLPFDLADQA